MSGQPPSVGRVVQYTPPVDPLDVHLGSATGPVALAALICKVHDDGAVNLAVFDEMGMSSPRLCVRFTEAKAGTEEARGRWSWPAFVPPKPAEVSK